LKDIVALELVKISEEEKTEEELLADISAIEHDENVNRLHRLEDCLCYKETQHKYVYHLLEELHMLLKQELHIVDKLSASQNESILIAKLKECWKLEKIILEKIKMEDMASFHPFFVALLKGEQLIQRLSEEETRLISKMQKEMDEDEGLIAEWANEVYFAIKDKVHEAVANGILEHHMYIHLEFVNRPEFVDLVRSTLKSIQSKHKQEVSESEINVFVHVFREWYNGRPD